MHISRFFKGVIVLALCSTFCACGAADTRPSSIAQGDNTVLRADPGQAQWLEKQSMLNASVELAKVVSASSISWQLSPVGEAHQELFKHANTWLSVNPTTLITPGDQSAFAHLRSSSIWRALQQNNIRGLYIAPAFSSGSVWSGSYYVMDDYDDPVSFSFSDAAGSDKEYFSLLQEANRNKAILGVQLVPSATGIGPDFFLAARNMRNYPGIYCMVEVPESLWDQLPAAKSEWDVQVIEPDQVLALGNSGLFAPVFTQEAQLNLPGGWAATGEVRGIDGQLRRFAYRYYNNPHRAVLNWSDPSAAGRRVVSGSIVRSVGELGAAFVGTSFLPLSGLMPYEQPVPGQTAFEPGLSASSDVGQEVRRYGGWSWNKDRMPLPMLQAYLNQRVDFVNDSIISTGAGHALVTGQASLLRVSLDRAQELDIDFSRLVHCMPGSDGLFYKNGLPESRAAFSELINYPGVSNILKDGTLQATGAALAAISLGFGPEQDIDENAKQKIQKGHEAMAFFMAAQPGLFMVPAHDVMGALPAGWIPKEVYSQATDSNQTQGGVSLLGERKRILISGKGVVATPTLYQGIDIQASLDGSFLNHVGKLAAMRDRTDVGAGKYLGRGKTQGSGIVIVFTELPGNKGVLIAATNFNKNAANESVRLADIPASKSLPGGKLVDPFSGKNIGSANGSVNISVPGWGTKAVVVQPRGSSPLNEVGLDEAAINGKNRPEQPGSDKAAGQGEERQPDVFTWDDAGENWDQLVDAEAVPGTGDEAAESPEGAEAVASSAAEAASEETVRPAPSAEQRNSTSEERSVIETAPEKPDAVTHGNNDQYDWEPFPEDHEAVEDDK